MFPSAFVRLCGRSGLVAAALIAWALAPVAPATAAFSIDVDSKRTKGNDITGSIVTAAGFTSLDATNADTASVTTGGVTFATFGVGTGGSRIRSGPDALTRDFIFSGSGGFGLTVENLPDNQYQAEVWTHDADFPPADQSIGLVDDPGMTGDEQTFTGTHESSTAPFTFQFNSADWSDAETSGDDFAGFGIFVRENNSKERARFNALRLTVVPEPASAALLGLGGLGLLRRRKRG